MQQLYDLVPEIYRTKDRALGYPLRALMQTLQLEYDAISANIDALYNDWFIETCADWVVPYLGELVGIETIKSTPANVKTQRKRVADALLFLSHNGLLTTLGQAATGASGWPTIAVDQRQTTMTSFNVTAPSQRRIASVNFSDQNQMAVLNSAFATQTTTINVRTPSLDAAEFSLTTPTSGVSNVALVPLKTKAFPISQATAKQRPATPNEPDQGLLWSGHFHAMGVDTPLYSLAQAKANFITPETADNYPLPITRLGFSAALNTPENTTPLPFSVTAITAKGANRLDRQNLQAGDLSDWGQSFATDRIKAASLEQFAICAVVDPVLGRLQISPNADPILDVLVDYNAGFADALGGGPYQKPALEFDPQNTWQGVVALPIPASSHDPQTSAPASNAADQFTSITDAITAWAALSPPQSGILWIADNQTHVLPDNAAIQLNGQNLTLAAWDKFCPTLQGDLTVSSSSSIPALNLTGLHLDGALTLGSAIALTLQDSTLAPRLITSAKPALQTTATTPETISIVAKNSVIGAIVLPWMAGGIVCDTCIIAAISGPKDETAPPNVTAFGPLASFAKTTILGSAKIHTLVKASDTLFGGETLIGSQSYDAFERCFINSHVHGDPVFGTQNPPARVSFETKRFGDPLFASLAPTTSRSVIGGGPWLSEIGVFHDLFQPQRRSNLKETVPQYVPLGVQLGLYSTE